MSGFVREGYSRVVPYLTVRGADAVADFITEVFGAKVLDRSHRPDGKLAHAAVTIGDSTIEPSEATERFGPMPGAVHVYVPDADHTHEPALRCGARAIHEPMDMEYGERASAAVDKAGNHWDIASVRRPYVAR